jgi:arylsulfatase A
MKIIFLIGMGVLAAWSGQLLAAAPKPPVKPNIVLIVADDLGYECIGANGGTSYKTPVLDKLAATGIRFEHCYSQPLCTPSRVQLMTGIYNDRNYVGFGRMDRTQTTFAHLLKKQGYATAVAGKWQLGQEADSPNHFGFDEACLWQHMRGNSRTGPGGQRQDTRYANPSLEINGKPVDYSTGEFGPDVVSDFVCRWIERNTDKPFFVYYPMILPHAPFVPTPDSADWDPTGAGRANPKYFADMVSYMDTTVGTIITKLEALGLRDNTLVLFTGDNGTAPGIVSMLNREPVRGGKKQMTDAGTRVPLIANWPGAIPSGVVSQDLVDFSDFLPTLCDASAMAVPEELKIDGRSFLPQLRGERGHPRDWIYSRHAGKRWARNQRYKLYATGEFYDIKNDALESHPLSEPSAEAAQIRSLLQDALNRYKDARPAQMHKPDKNGKLSLDEFKAGMPKPKK